MMLILTNIPTVGEPEKLYRKTVWRLKMPQLSGVREESSLQIPQPLLS
jgi:hypothetical protein